MLKVQNIQNNLFKVSIDYIEQNARMVTWPYTVMTPYDIYHLNSSGLLNILPTGLPT